MYIYVYIYLFIYHSMYIYIYIYHSISKPRRAEVRLVFREVPGPAVRPTSLLRFYMRNVLGWLETRLAQHTSNYLNIWYITLNHNTHFHLLNMLMYVNVF